ncbi:S8 family serine peptidase [Phycicoccus sp. MAQZ13P-2]|uniref:S8 family serine peptidase n=1 Tax=Phycicoccus mangrovi TaxID=2840470 RepID=UPI001C0039D0|nr:S8 family serine peptidase [Phycicoccus mangrovi]MBT9253987.1 S8 family serine peptidase [Phycicoccus mangrovi]MBT9275600.1 S8 family serine peptidase [Phycicoccus mangrovi]
MRRSLVVSVVAAATALVAAPAAPAAPLTPTPPVVPAAVERMLAGVPDGSAVPVLVRLRENGLGPSTLAAGGTEGARRTALVRGLREGAGARQRGVLAAVDGLARRGEVRSRTALWVTDAVAVTATPDAVRELAARPDVASVVPDRIVLTPAAVPVEPTIDATGAPAVWAAGRTGTGVVVASLDSGVDLTSPDLAATWRGGSSSWFDPYGEHPDAPVDLLGHGTAVTGTMVGGEDAGSAYGMAPGARWVAARVFDDRGTATLSAIHQAFQWVLDPDHDPSTDDAPDVVNLSWSLGTGPGCDLAVQPDLAALRAAGILPVAAAGNFGAAAGTSASPANYPEALSVGAVTTGGALWSFSSTGPSDCGGRTRPFPDLVAPGVDVLTADLYGSYQVVDGTSIAAPHVAGAAALLLQGRPTTTPDALAAALTTTARDLGATGPDDVYGAGLVDVAAADAALTPAAPTGDFSVVVRPRRVALAPGATASIIVRVAPTDGYDAATSLSLSGIDPSEARWRFVREQVGPGAWRTRLRLQLRSAATRGVHRLVVTATGGGIERSAPLTVVVVGGR